ncbi:MAG: DUF2815 domain-containing protein [Solimonas sp.]
MSDNKRVSVPFNTGRGIGIWPKLDKPDTKFAAEGVYTTKLKLEGEAAEQRIKRITDLANKQLEESRAELVSKKKHAEAKKLRVTDLPFKAEYDGDGNETGATIFSFKMKASGVKKDGKPWTRRPAIFDAAGKAIPAARVPPVGGGSVLVVAGNDEPYCNPKGEVGVSARLEAVQIIELKTFADKDAAQFGFGAEEGYEAEEGVTPHGFGDESAPATGEPASGDDF